ncbi:MAG: FxLYD domain-containing protein [Anaerolineae bacterium]
MRWDTRAAHNALSSAIARARRLLGHRAVAIVAPTIAVGLLVAATACSAPVGATKSGVLSALAVEATPTLPAPGEDEARYLPMLIQGLWLAPTPTATAGPYNSLPKTMNQGLEVLSARTSQRASGDRYLLEVEGEVRNSGTQRAQSVRVVLVAGYQDRQCGRGVLTLLGQEDTILIPGDVWPFSGSMYMDCSPQEVAFQVVAVDTDTTPLRLAVEGVTVSATSAGDWQLSGTLRNHASVTVSYPRAVVTLHGADGSYVASGLAYAGISALAPGGTATFVVVIPAAKASGWASYAVEGTGEIG